MTAEPDIEQALADEVQRIAAFRGADSGTLRLAAVRVPKAKKSVALLKYFKRRRLRPRVTLTVTVSAPKQIGIVKTHKVAKGKLTSPTTRCLPAGTTKAVKC